MYPWAGAMFQPGPKPMAAADLSAARGFTFQARGDGAVYRVMVFSHGRGRPSMYDFVAGSKWTQYRLTFQGNFDGLDGSDVMGIAFVAGPKPGAFHFQIDQVELGVSGGAAPTGSR
jgi:hypothetical protein